MLEPVFVRGNEKGGDETPPFVIPEVTLLYQF